jgi:hypothetical protein
VRIDYSVDPESHAPEWKVVRDRGTAIVAVARDLPAAIVDAIRRSGRSSDRE